MYSLLRFTTFLRESASLVALRDALDEESPEDYPAFLKQNGVTFKTVTSPNGQNTVYSFALNGTWYVLEDGDDCIQDAEEWVNSMMSPDQWIELPDFNKDFWESPGALYHATPTENVESIQKIGLVASNHTRGLSNRGIGSAVFTTDNMERLEDGSYGDAIFEIDCAAMKRDGHRPEVEREPDIVEGELRETLASKLGMRDYSAPEDSSSGEWPDTVIVFGNIPAKYLKLLD